MASTRKRTSDQISAKSENPKCPSCIVHAIDIRDYGPVTSFRSVRGIPDEKLAYLHEIREKRMAEPLDSPRRMEAVSTQIPETLDGVDLEMIGYHRPCYQRFTANLHRLKDSTEASTSTKHHSPRKPASLCAESSQLFPPECMFCEKLEIKVSGKTERPIKFLSWKHKEPAWKSIESQALELGKTRLYRQVKGKDLFAVEAQFHSECRMSFTTEYRNHIRTQEREENRNLDTDQAHRAAAHNAAFNLVVEHIQKHIVEQKQILQLSSLRLVYITELVQQHFPNHDYRSDKLMNRLKNHDVNGKIVFSKVAAKGCIAFYLVYSAAITVADAVPLAYKLASADTVQDVALLLRGTIKQAHKTTTALPWPPTVDDMQIKTDVLLPEYLVRFLNLLLAGTPDVAETNEKSRRLVLSIGQDLCRAVTNGEWKLPKHILMCTTIRHLYRSKQLTTILHRLGHSESYDFALELETATAKAIEEVSTYLSPQIVTYEGNLVFHCEWDNLNKITTNVHGSNVVNSAGGIMIQETKPGFVSTQERTLPLYDRSKEKSLKVETSRTLLSLHIYTRVGPSFPVGAIFTPPAENDIVYGTSMQEYYVWLLCRLVGSNGTQPMPALGGFISATGTAPKKKSTIDYFTPINQPITEYAVVQELLSRTEAATEAVGQKYVINTFDLGVCMKALPLIWKFPENYINHIVIPGQFHTGMNYMGMLTAHKCRGSGYTEILLEAQLVTSGCLKSVLSGKAYAKALFCLKTVCEAMERLLMERFIDEENIQIVDPEAILNLMKSCDRQHLDLALIDPSTQNIIQKYQAFEDKVRSGHLGKTATFWFSFIEHSHLIFMLLYSVKTNNLQLFHKCNGEMAALFFAFDGHNYSRYLVWLEVFLTNLELSHPGATDLLAKGAIAVARSLIPGALSAVDKTMEETFMKFAKSAGGLSGLFNMFGAYQRWCRTTSGRAQFFERTLEMCGMIDDPECPKAGKHRELEAAQIRKSEKAVQRTLVAIRSFTNPFTIADKDRLYSLASGAPVPLDAEVDVLRAEAVGKTAKETFIKERFQNGCETSFFDPIKRKKLLTMEACNKMVKLTSTQGKLVQYQQQSNLAFLLLVKSQLLDEPLDLDELMRYSLAPVPHSLGTPDGFFAKTNKAAMLHFLLEDTPDDVPYPKDAMYIQDGMALWYCLTNLLPTCGGICLQVLDHMASKKNFIFSTDSYQPDSIKAQERLRRGSSEKFIVDGPATRKPTDFKLFLANEDNKMQLCQLLLKVWGSREAASRLENCGTAMVIVDGTAHQLVSSNGDVEVSDIPELLSDQEETDSRVVLYLNHAVNLKFKSAVVRTPDTDIFFILLHHSHSINLTIFLDTGIGKHRQIVNVTELGETLGSDYCSTLLGYYVFSGEDCTSAFKGKGKVTPLKKLQKYPRFHRAFRQLGEEWTVTSEVQQQLEQFTCIMYGEARESLVNTVRAKMLKKMVGEDTKLTTKSKVDLARLPPCQNSLIPHVQRVNYRVACYKRAHQPIFTRPKPYDAGQGWEKTGQGILEPVWSCGPILPSSLIDLLETVDSEDEVEDLVEEEDPDYDDLDDGNDE